MNRRTCSSAGLIPALLLGLMLTVLAPQPASARFDGINKGGTGCDPCHGSEADQGLVVTITGPSTLLPNQTAQYTLTINVQNAGGALSVATSAGTLTATDANTRVLTGMITHLDAFNAAPAGNIGDWDYNFDLTAPASIGSTILLSSTGMAFNGNFANDSGDIWSNIGSGFSIAVIPEPGTGLLLGMGLGILGAVGRRQAAHRSLRLR
jgi:hypothetical protein